MEKKYTKATREDCFNKGLSFPETGSHYRVLVRSLDNRTWFQKLTGKRVPNGLEWVLPEEVIN